MACNKNLYRVWLCPRSYSSQPSGLSLEKALVAFMLDKGLATNPSGDCCNLLPIAAAVSGTGTDLTFSRDDISGMVFSSTGTDITIPAATSVFAGLMTAIDKEKVDFIAITQPVDLDAIESDLSNLIVLSGGSGAQNYTSFPGTTIPNNSTIYSALQALETSVETKQTAIQWQDETINLSTSTVNTVNFVGTGVTAIRAGNTITVTVPGSGGGLTKREARFVATVAQTSFLTSYAAAAPSGDALPVEVYRNGIRLTWKASAPGLDEFSYITNTITTTACLAGDKVVVTYLN